MSNTIRPCPGLEPQALEPRGGGGMVIKHGVNFLCLNGVTGLNVDTFESLFVKLPQPNNTDLIIGSIYRQSVPDFLADFEITLHYLSETKKKIFLAGDYNLNILKYNEHPSTSNFLNLLATCKFLPVILRPTRITEFTATLIGNIYTNCHSYNMDSCILVEDISDHLPIMLYIDFYRMSTGKVNALPKRTFGEREKSDFLLSLQQVDWSGVDALALSEGPDVAYYSDFINQYMTL